MKLVYESSGIPVSIGDTVTVRNEVVIITDIAEPHKPSSTGRVYVKDILETDGMSIGYFPSVVGAKWIEREDHL